MSKKCVCLSLSVCIIHTRIKFESGVLSANNSVQRKFRYDTSLSGSGDLRIIGGLLGSVVNTCVGHADGGLYSYFNDEIRILQTSIPSGKSFDKTRRGYIVPPSSTLPGTEPHKHVII